MARIGSRRRKGKMSKIKKPMIISAGVFASLLLISPAFIRPQIDTDREHAAEEKVSDTQIAEIRRRMTALGDYAQITKCSVEANQNSPHGDFEAYRQRNGKLVYVGPAKQIYFFDKCMDRYGHPFGKD
jgi:hypothetical protein